ncbi:Tetratricopeptide repeat (TPR)-like superfamily protein, partial [Zostera marina]
SYRRALELEDSKLFALVESGGILLMLGSFSEGVEQMRSASKLSPNNVSACFGLASGLLGLSKECISSGAFSWGASLLEEASSVAKTCINLVGNLSSIWKLLGDIQMAHARCFPWVKENTHIKVNKEVLEASIHRWRNTCKSSAVNAKQSYQRALHLTPWEASIYTDIAISLDLVQSFEGKSVLDLNSWSLPEKMTLGGLMLDGVNIDIWMILGCLSNKNVLKQHSFIRALQLDVSFAVAWAHLGKFYRNIGENKLAKLSFDHARSIDPSLALPWASMSVCIDAYTKENSIEEAYESCLRAAQIMP